jgi:anti-sigma B factor antagonist
VTVEAIGGAHDAPRVLRARGELDVATVPHLLPELPSLVEGALGVVLDLTAVTFLDSAGVRFVDRLGRECARLEIPYRVVVPPGHRARRVLAIVGFVPPVVTDDLHAGLAAVREEAS